MNNTGHICDFSESISRDFFSEHNTYGLGLLEIIKSKKGKSIEPKELNNICIVFHVNGLRKEF